MAIVGAGLAGTNLAAVLGMDAEKICAFHDDPVKVATDRGGMRSSI